MFNQCVPRASLCAGAGKSEVLDTIAKSAILGDGSGFEEKRANGCVVSDVMVHSLDEPSSRVDVSKP